MQESYVLYKDNNKEYVMELIDYLDKKDIPARYELDEEDGLHCIIVPEALQFDGKTALSEYFNMELDEEEDVKEQILLEKVKSYRTSADKYSDMKSSGIAMIVVGILGVAFILMKIFDVINFDFYGLYNIIFTVLFSVIFVLILFFGFYSLLKAKKIAGNINSEEEVTDSILIWFNANHTPESIDSNLDSTDENEPAYFKRTEYMKTVIKEKYSDLHEGYLDAIIEDLYSEYFPD